MLAMSCAVSPANLFFIWNEIQIESLEKKKIILDLRFFTNKIPEG